MLTNFAIHVIHGQAPNQCSDARRFSSHFEVSVKQSSMRDVPYQYNQGRKSTGKDI